MRIVNKLNFFMGVFVIIFLIVSYFFKVSIEVGLNYFVEDSLLGIIIFHNFFVLLTYLIIAGFFIFTGVKRIKLI